MKKIFDEQLGIEPDCVWVGDEQPRCFVSIELSDDVRDLVE
jgi:hypothetical protein